jgi:ATP-dependent RNA helicase MSS116
LTVIFVLTILQSIAQARTGTGKTLGFLIPVVQSVLNELPELAQFNPRASRARPSDIRSIIIAPTRELAEQIAVEAKKITRNTNIKVQVATGGNSKSLMLRNIQREGCHLLVATPGRLYDLLSDEYSRVSAPELTSFVLDEADRLLDDGFSKDIEEILTCLPDRKVKDRQTLLFSATVPREVMYLVRKTLKPDFQFVQTVQEGEQATHEKIPQKLIKVPSFENVMPTLLEFCKREIEASKRAEMEGVNAKPFKAIVYFSSTANAILAANIFSNLKARGDGLFGRNLLWPAHISAMHGQLTQAQRTRVSDRFRKASSAIMFSTDVTARGMDFPGVTHVIQVGLPPNRDQYIHRVGRTGRGHSTGEALLILADVELDAARQTLRQLPIKPDTSLEVPKVDMTKDAQLTAATAETLTQIAEATKSVDRGTKSAAYLAAFGSSQTIRDKQRFVDSINQWTRYGWGWAVPPRIGANLAAKLGAGRVQGLNKHDNDYGSEDEGFANKDAFEFGDSRRSNHSSGSRFDDRVSGARDFGGSDGGYGGRDGGRGRGRDGGGGRFGSGGARREGGGGRFGSGGGRRGGDDRRGGGGFGRRETRDSAPEW